MNPQNQNDIKAAEYISADLSRETQRKQEEEFTMDAYKNEFLIDKTGSNDSGGPTLWMVSILWNGFSRRKTLAGKVTFVVMWILALGLLSILVKSLTGS